MYIVLLALKKRAGYSKRDFITAMKEVIVPVTMTSLVNASMFAVMNITDIQAIYKTANVALISVIFLYLTIILCFPSYCYQDMKRQAAGRYDVLFCIKKKDQPEEEAADEDEEAKKTRLENIASHVPEDPSSVLYDKMYRPLVLGDGWFSKANRIFIWLASLALLGLGIWGITQRELGLGVEEFFPTDHQARVVRVLLFVIPLSLGVSIRDRHCRCLVTKRELAHVFDRFDVVIPLFCTFLI